MAYFDKYGVEFSDDRKTLVRCPKDFRGEYVIPDSVTSIGNYAFYECYSLTSVTIPNSVKSIEHNAFSGCTGLESVTIPNSVTSIGEEAFRGCTGLTSVTIPDSVTSCGKYVFGDCEKLTEIAVLNANVSIMHGICNQFLGNWYQLQPYGSVCLDTILVSYKLSPNEVLKQYKVPDNIRYIANGAFEDCKDLISIDFNNAQIVESELPDSVTTIIASGGSLQRIEGLINTSWYKNQPDGCVYIGNLLLGYKSENNEIPCQIQLREGTRSINAYAFYEMGEVEFEIICDDELTIIGEHAFENSKICKISAPCLQEIREYAFCNSRLRSIELSDYLQKIGEYAFYHCDLGQIITIPSSIKEIPMWAFAGNKGLDNVHIEDYGARIIGQCAFADCSLRSIFIPENVKEIGAGAFKWNNRISDIYLSEGLEIIGEGAFAFGEEYAYGMVNSLIIPSSVKRIGEDAFYFGKWWVSIETLVIKSDIDICWKNTINAVETVILKEGVTTIYHHGFYGCRIKNIILPDTIQAIGEFAFEDCFSLEILILPSKVNELWVNSLPPHIKKVMVKSGELKLKIGSRSREQYDYLIKNNVFVDENGDVIVPSLCIYKLGEENPNGTYHVKHSAKYRENGTIISFDGKKFDVNEVDCFEDKSDSRRAGNGSIDDNQERPTYSRYGGYNGYDDDTIDSAFEGDPEATWNID